MKKMLWYVLGIVVLAGIAAFGWWTLSPLFIDRIVDEELVYEPSVEETTDAPAESTREKSIAATRAGTFVGADPVHQGSGTARIIETNDGAVLQLEDFEVTNGPDLYVLLAENAAPQTHDEFGEYLELARLKGNIGNQRYALPAGMDAGTYSSVVIYCKAFSVVFATATLR